MTASDGALPMMMRVESPKVLPMTRRYVSLRPRITLPSERMLAWSLGRIGTDTVRTETFWPLRRVTLQ